MNTSAIRPRAGHIRARPERVLSNDTHNNESPEDILNMHNVSNTRPGRGARRSPLASASLAAASLLALTAPALAQSNRSIINGGFEQPDVALGVVAFFDEGQVPGWETSASDGQMEFWGSGFQGVPAFEGDQFVELNANLVATLFQPLCLVPGDSVSWSFAHRGRLGNDTLRLTIGTDVITTVTTGTADWSINEGTYTPTLTASAPVQFFFESVSAAGGSGAGNFLDDVEIVLPPHYELGAAAGSGAEAAGDNLPLLLVSGTLTTPGSVDVAIAGTATPGADYTFTATVTVPAGEYDGTAATGIPLGIAILDDGAVEADETLIITIANATGENQGNPARIADVDCNDTALATATYTITNDDADPVCGNAQVEGNEGCDDGDTTAGDGCSSTCTLEVDWECARADFSLVAEDVQLGDTDVAAVWELSEDRFSVFQSVNSDPGVYVSNLPVMNSGDVVFTIAVETTDDDDFVGVVLGFDDGEFDDASASYLLIDWKQATQDDGGNFGIADEGLAVSLVTGDTDVFDLWSHAEGSTVRELARAANLGAAGWEDNVTYTWTLNYTETTLTLRVNDVEEINIKAADFGLDAFPAGTLGFYNYSQATVRYSLLSPRGGSVCQYEPGICVGFDDNLDADTDGVPDGCDVCAGDDGEDADSDGVPDGCDVCADGDDGEDADSDGMPDGCDVCAMDEENDADGDGACESDDNCPLLANPDQSDGNADGVGDACSPRYGLQGGGCSATNGASGGWSALLIALALLLMHRWSRRRAPRAA
jgi:MYXO-CTERM domain-containing protein